MLAAALLVLGLGLQLIGAVLAVLGLRKTWRQFAPSDASLGEAIWREVSVMAREAWTRTRQRLDRFLDRLLRRRRNVVVNVEGALMAVGTLNATVIRGYGPLPRAAKAALPVVHERLNELRGELDTLAGRLGGATGEMERIEKRLDEAKQALEERDEKIAIGGIPLAVAGLSLVAIGVVAQLVAEAVRMTGW
ncbi:MAG TPA: hypothetical protein VM305_11810 [Candidatus Limnocylindrales bacterium]|nr:hypothetical protein [Candidatus Limnocylindrales bacterium]